MGLLDSYPDRYMPTNHESRVGISHSEVSIHNGLSFHATHKITHGATAPSSATMLITTPASSVAAYHVTMTVEASKSGIWSFEEAASATSGTTITPLNMSRSSTTTSGTTITHTAVLTTTAGTILEQHIIGASAGNPSIAAQGGRGMALEWELAASTSYLLRFIADAATTITVMNIQLEKEEG